MELDFTAKKILINKKSLKELRKRKKKKTVKIKVSPQIASDLGLRFFVGLQKSFDAYAWAMTKGIFCLLPNSIKISVKNDDNRQISLSVITKITIFRIALSLLKNIKIKRK